MAEETDLIVLLGSYVLGQAINDIARWQKELPRPEQPLFVSVNVSSRQLIKPDLVQEIRHAIGRAVLPPGTLRLEITESLVMENPERATHILDLLKEAGIQLALDDFGTGYSSLAYLNRFPFDTIKIDQALVQSSSEAQSNAVIVRSIVALAQELGKRIVAEGVETAEDAAFLRSIGCQYAQGFYYGEPMGEADIGRLLRLMRKADRRMRRRGLVRAQEKRKPRNDVPDTPRPATPATTPVAPAPIRAPQRPEDSRPLQAPPVPQGGPPPGRPQMQAPMPPPQSAPPTAPNAANGGMPPGRPSLPPGPPNGAPTSGPPRLEILDGPLPNGQSGPLPSGPPGAPPLAPPLPHQRGNSLPPQLPPQHANGPPPQPTHGPPEAAQPRTATPRLRPPRKANLDALSPAVAASLAKLAGGAARARASQTGTAPPDAKPPGPGAEKLPGSSAPAAPKASDAAE